MLNIFQKISLANRITKAIKKSKKIIDPWKNNLLGVKKSINGSKRLAFKLYGLEWYNSINSETPFGQNDGALWQGKGYNLKLTTGI